MSKEIIIKSPIKILTERSNCTQLNDGEIGIYQPPYRYKNTDGTLGDLKCKKVQIYTKINGEIRKTNTYKPTGIIHHKPIPYNARPGEIYYTNFLKLNLTFPPKTITTIKFPYIQESVFDEMLAILALESGDKFLPYLFETEINSKVFVLSFRNGKIIFSSLTSQIYKKQLMVRLPVRGYYSFVNHGKGNILVLSENTNLKIHSQKKIKKMYLRKKRKMIAERNFAPIDIGFPFKKYRYVKCNSGFGLVQEAFFKRRRTHKHWERVLKKINLPQAQYRKLRGGGD